jgi:UDP-N-acetylmuramyl pentapeptide synthase
VADAEAATAVIAGEARRGDVILVKASRGVELERVVDGLVAALGGPAA